MDILRSLLFVPGNRERMLAAAGKAGADAIVIDLEDAVPATAKRAARTMARNAVLRHTAAGLRVFVRVNGVSSGMTRDDVMAVVRPGLAGIVHPKTESAQDLRDLDVLLREAEMRHKVRPGDIRTIPLIESARGVLRCEEIVKGSDRVDAISIGGEDYTAELGVERERGGAAIAHLRQVVVTVATAYGINAIDTPYADFKDVAGLRADAALARSIGFKGKYVIHPSQVELVNKLFTPSATEVAQARRVIAAAASAAKRRRGAVALDGRMIDAPVVERARRLLALAAEATPGAKRARS